MACLCWRCALRCFTCRAAPHAPATMLVLSRPSRRAVAHRRRLQPDTRPVVHAANAPRRKPTAHPPTAALRAVVIADRLPLRNLPRWKQLSPATSPSRKRCRRVYKRRVLSCCLPARTRQRRAKTGKARAINPACPPILLCACFAHDTLPDHSRLNEGLCDALGLWRALYCVYATTLATGRLL